MRCFLLFLLFLSPAPLWAADYYVSPSGADSNPGTLEKPWRNLQKAAETLGPGDRVLIRAGIYRERVHPVRSGTEALPILYEAYPGEKPVLDGKGIRLADWSGLFMLEKVSYILVKGLTVQHTGPYESNAGFMVEGSDHVTLTGNRTYNTRSSGIGVWHSRDVVVEGTKVELACHGGSEECITVAQTDGFEVKDNEVYHGGSGHHGDGGEGIDAKDGACHGTIHGNRVHHLLHLGIYVDAWDLPTHDVEVFNNVSHDNQSDGMAVAAEDGGVLERVSIHDNVVYHNKHNGFEVANWGEPVPHHPIRHIQVFQNTFWGNGTGQWGGGIRLDNSEAEDLLVQNNIVADNYSFQIGVGKKPTGMIIRHNFIQGYRHSRGEGETRGEDFTEGKALFENPEEGDFRLRPQSPAKGFGCLSPVATPKIGGRNLR